ncbi:MAG: response regulator [Acidobacteriota bacterium]
MKPAILIVEDDPSTRLLLVTLLKRLGAECVVAPNGAEAMVLLRERAFDLIILDLMMAGVSGYDVIAFLQAEGRRERVIVCTAAGPRSTAELDRSIVRAVVTKPFDILEFTAIVDHHLKTGE